MKNDARHYEPHPIEKMHDKNPKHTICETLRQSYRDIERGALESAMLNIRIAVTMARAMDRRLKEYKCQKKSQ